MSRSDPIRDNYFSAAQSADRANDLLFYAAAVLSVAAIFVDAQAYPNLHAWIQVSFATTAAGLFVTGMAIRLHFFPRAENKRRQEFFGQAFGVALTHERTDGYYNNQLTQPLQRMAAQVLENSLFTKAIASAMVRQVRVTAGLYVLVWVVCMLSRQTDLGIVIAISQVVLSEQIVSRWLRLEWLRGSSERVFDDMYQLFHATPTDAEKFNATALHLLGVYEAAKVNAAILLDTKVFNRLNARLSREWEQIQKELHLTSTPPSSGTTD
jgi:hypothetical protein